jgi:hypothetical protein
MALTAVSERNGWRTRATFWQAPIRGPVGSENPERDLPSCVACLQAMSRHWLVVQAPIE